VFLALALWAGGATWAADADLATAIDVAGRQRMLTQRIVKAYCQLGLGVTPDVSRAQLTNAVQRFDAQLDDLDRAAPDASARDALARLRERFGGLRSVATGAVSRDGARELATRGDDVLQAAQQVVALFERAAATPQARLVNLSGRQRMLSQRLAKLYMLRAWQVDTPSLSEELKATRSEFERALATLRTARENTLAIARELDAVALQWEWFKTALSLQGVDSYVFLVGEASEAMLNSMELVTAKYAELAR
jgi:hypothetical protein